LEKIVRIIEISPAGSKIEEWMTGVLVDNMSLFETCVENLLTIGHSASLISSSRAMDALVTVGERADDNVKVRVADFIENNIQILSDPRITNNSNKESVLWKKRFERMEKVDEKSEVIAQSIRTTLKNEWTVPRMVDSILDDNFIKNFPDKVSLYIKMMAEMAGVSSEISNDIVCSWLTLDRDECKESSINYEDRLREIVTNNIQRIIVLREKIGDADGDPIVGLYKLFGITHFARYGELLEEQWKSRNDNSSKYGIWIGSYADSNGVFNNDLEAINNFVESAKALGMKVRIVEARGKISVAKRILQLDEKYGENNKISFMVISAHGNGTEGDELILGEVSETNRDGVITASNLTSKSVSKINNCYDTTMPIAFNVCRAVDKVEGGLGYEYSQHVTDGVVVGVATDLTGIEISLRSDLNNNLRFEFNKGDSDVSHLIKGSSINFV